MKKIYTALCAALATLGANAQNGNLVLETPATGVEYQVTSLSPNGKWACGSLNDAAQRAFLWNLTSGEIIELSVPGISSLGLKVSNDGVVSGSFETTEGTPNNVPLATYGYCKDGKWVALGLENEADGTTLIRDGYAGAVSNNSQYFAGIAHDGEGYRPVLWTNNTPTIIDKESGAIYDISDDAKILCGWINHPKKKNRTCVIWKLGKDGKYEKTFMDLDSPWSSGPFAVATDISPNNRYVVGYNRVWDLSNDKYVEHDFSYATGGFELIGVTNSGAAYGYHDPGEWGGTEKAAIMIAQDHKTTVMRDYLIEKGVDLSKYPFLQMTTGVSEDEKTFSFLAYDDQFYPHSLVVKLDIDTLAMAPVALQNRPLEGINANRISWKAPLKNLKALQGYNIYRNGQKVNTTLLDTTLFIDSQLTAGDYSYTVTAVYNGKESEQSEALCANIAEPAHQQPRNLLAIPSSRNDVRLVWEAPYSSLPALKYFEADEVVASIGGGSYSFEGAIAARTAELELYRKQGYQISQISFQPESPQKSWTVNFYTADNDQEPIYSEVIPNEGLVYGALNYHTLKTPLSIPEGKGLIMSIAVDATGFGGYNILGMSPKKADPRYSDLIRQKGEKDFYSMYEASMNSEEGPMEYNVRWAMAMHFAKNGETAGNAVKQYLVTANGKPMGTTEEQKMRLKNLDEGNYTFSVTAEYANGKQSAATTAQLEVVNNDDIYKEVVPEVTINEQTANLTWTTPADDDANIISFANTPCNGGLVGTEDNQYNYMIATRYFGEKLKNYEDFEITGFRFYPLSDADFTFFLKVNGELAVEKAIDNGNGYIKNQWNTVKLEKPVKINRHSEYMLLLDCYDVTPEEAPVGMDSEIGFPGVSDLYSTDDGEHFLSLISDGGKNANWMIALEVAAAEPKPLPVEGYNVYLTNKKQNESPVKENQYTLEDLKSGTYQVRVNPIYTGPGEKKSKAVTFVIDVNSGIEALQQGTLEVTKNANTLEVKGDNVTGIEAFSRSGALVAKSNSQRLDIAQLPTGVYILKIHTEGKTVTAKISLDKQ